MTTKELINNLHALQGIQSGGDPAASWRAATRDELVQNAVRDLRAAPAFPAHVVVASWIRATFPRNLNALVFKPVLVGVAALGVLLGGWVTTVSASYNSLPGDAFYGVKLAAERAQVSLVAREGDRAKLRVEFLGRRVDEVAKIADSPGDTDARAEQVSAVVRRITEQAASVQKNLETLKTSKSDETVEVARLVDRKAGEFQHSLTSSVPNVPAAAQAEVKAASSLVADTSVKAVAVLMDSHAQGNVAVSTDSIKEKIEEHIATASAETPAAKQTLTAAKELLAKNDLSGALSKIAEVSKLSLEQAQAATSSPASSTLTAPLPTSGEGVTLPLFGKTPLPSEMNSSTPR